MVNTEISLGRSEKVLWSGVPSQGLIFRAADVFMIPFSLVWASAVLSTFLVVKHLPTDAPFAAFSVVFVFMALYFTVGRFIVHAWARARTTYGVTTERVIIQSGLFTQTVTSLNLRTLSDVTLSERANGRGTITFGSGNPWGAWGNMMRWPGMPQVPMFEGIPRRAERLRHHLRCTAQISTRSGLVTTPRRAAGCPVVRRIKWLS